MKQSTLLSALLLSLVSFAVGCSRQDTPTVQVQPQTTDAPDPGGITQDPRLPQRAPAAARSRTELFKDIDTDEDKSISDEELRLANIYCSRWFPTDRKFVEDLYERMAKYGHVVKEEVIHPLTNKGPSKDSITVKRYAISPAEFEKAWQELRTPEQPQTPESQTR